MGEAWQRLGVISPGGTVSGVANTWLATGAGIFGRWGDAWQPLPHGQPLSQLNSLLHTGKALLAGGGGVIVYSTDGGETWYQSHIREPSKGVTCLAASPAVRHDGVVLAGTDGSGILRSTDGGRNWQLSNAGLQDFTVLALATAPEWGRREVIFAGTAHGLYRSPNAGRAWKKLGSGIGDWVFQAVAVRPNFDRDGMVLAGTETNGLFRSADGGKTWDPVAFTPGDPPPINALWLHSELTTAPLCLLGTGDGRIFRSEEGGAGWTCVTSGHAPILCLAGAGQRLYAGLHHEGLLTSADGGQTWTADTDLAARAITRLVPGGGNELFAWGPLEGVWRSADRGETWRRLAGLDRSLPLFSLAVSPLPERPCLLASTAEGLVRSDDGGQSWQVVLQETTSTVVFSHRFAEEGRVWAATASGDLVTSADGGLTWASSHSPQPGTSLVVLAARPGALVVATHDVYRAQLAVWRSGDDGQTWEPWPRERIDWPSVHVSLAEEEGSEDYIGYGRTCQRYTRDGWQDTLETGSVIQRLQRLPDRAGMLVLTSSQVFYSADGLNWTSYDEGLTGQSLVDLALLPSGDAGPCAYILSTGGVLWRRHISA